MCDCPCYEHEDDPMTPALKTLNIWKVEAEGDTLYVEAVSLDNAKHIFRDQIGDMPDGFAKWTKLPKDWQPADSLFSWGDDILRGNL